MIRVSVISQLKSIPLTQVPFQQSHLLKQEVQHQLQKVEQRYCTVALSRQPAQTVTVALTSSDTGEFTVSPSECDVSPISVLLRQSH